MRLFRSKSEAIVGIDIGSYAIKLVELTGSVANPRVLSWGVAPLPAGAYTENAIADTEQVSETLNALLARTAVNGKSVAVSVSSSHAITKVLGMPNDIGDIELEEQIAIEAVHFIPYPIDEVNLDFEVLGPSVMSPDENDVLLVACRRSIVDNYIDLIEDSDLELCYIDIDTYALERLYRSQHSLSAKDSDPVAIFDVGAASCHLMVIDNERVLYSRHQNFGAAQLIKLIRREYGVSVEQASEFLRSSQLPSDFMRVVQEPFCEILRQELERALKFFYSSSAFSAVDKVVLAGGVCALEGLDAELQQKLRTSVSVLNPIVNANVKTNREAIGEVAPSLAVAFGLSLRGLG